MLSVLDYINLVLEKKRWTRVQLMREINKLEEHLGDTRTSKSKISAVLNGKERLGPRAAVKWEKALGLEEGTLLNMITSPISKEGKKELKELIRRVREIC